MNEGFWNICEAENEEVEIPNIEGMVNITSGSADMQHVYLRMIGSLIMYSNDSSDKFIRGYADIRYYSMVESTWRDSTTTWYEIELDARSGVSAR